MLFRTNAQSRGVREGAGRGRRALRGAGRRAVLRAGRGAPGDGGAAGGDPDRARTGAACGRRSSRRWRRSAGGPTPPPGGGVAREQWEALAALVGAGRGVQRRAVPHGRLAEFGEELARRAAQQHAPTVEGVTLASLHSAKGLEWDAVFLVGLAEGMLPTTYAKTPDAVEEERRLLYVGITRARQWLCCPTPSARSPGRPAAAAVPVPAAARRRPAASAAGRRETRDAGRHPPPACIAVSVPGLRRDPADAARDRKLGRCADLPVQIDEELFERLREWRVGLADGAEGAGVRRVHRRHPDRAGRAPADARRSSWSTSPASAPASSASTARRCSPWSPGRGRPISAPEPPAEGES